MRSCQVLLSAGLSVWLPIAVAEAGAPEKILHDFQGGPQGAFPGVALTPDSHGGFFGTTAGFQDFDGSVYEISPPAGGAHRWTLKVLHNFQGLRDGQGGAGTLAADASGNLFGVTNNGGAHQLGSVYELSPPAQGVTRWTKRTIYSFTGHRIDGTIPVGGVIFDAAGSLYGVTANGGNGPCSFGCGTVFKLTPSGGGLGGSGEWTETLLHQFQAGHDGAVPLAALVMDASGNIFGSAAGAGLLHECDGGCGTIFRLALESDGVNRKFSVIKELTADLGDSPLGPLLLDAAGNLFGTAFAWGRKFHGTAFELSPPAAGGTSWRATVLHSFTGGNDGYFPKAALIADASGTLYGTTEFGGADSQGVIFALHPPAMANAHWTESILHAFRYNNDGSGPTSPLIFGADGLLYGTTYQGGKHNLGTLFQIAP